MTFFLLHFFLKRGRNRISLSNCKHGFLLLQNLSNCKQKLNNAKVCKAIYKSLIKGTPLEANFRGCRGRPDFNWEKTNFRGLGKVQCFCICIRNRKDRPRGLTRRTIGFYDCGFTYHMDGAKNEYQNVSWYCHGYWLQSIAYHCISFYCHSQGKGSENAC